MLIIQWKTRTSSTSYPPTFHFSVPSSFDSVQSILYTHILFALIFVCTVQQSHCNDIWRFPWLSQEVAPPPLPTTPHIMHVKTAQKRHNRDFITGFSTLLAPSQRFSVFWIFLENLNWRRVSYAILLWTVHIYSAPACLLGRILGIGKRTRLPPVCAATYTGRTDHSSSL